MKRLFTMLISTMTCITCLLYSSCAKFIFGYTDYPKYKAHTLELDGKEEFPEYYSVVDDSISYFEYNGYRYYSSDVDIGKYSLSVSNTECYQSVPEPEIIVGWARGFYNAPYYLTFHESDTERNVLRFYHYVFLKEDFILPSKWEVKLSGVQYGDLYASFPAIIQLSTFVNKDEVIPSISAENRLGYIYFTLEEYDYLNIGYFYIYEFEDNLYLEDITEDAEDYREIADEYEDMIRNLFK